MKRFNLPRLEDVFIDIISSAEFEGCRGSPGNEDEHYKGKVQPNDLIEAQDLNFAAGNIVKLVCRYKDKGGLLDLGKIVFYTYRLIAQWLEGHPEDAEQFGWQEGKDNIGFVKDLKGFSVAHEPEEEGLDTRLCIWLPCKEAATCPPGTYINVGDGILYQALGASDCTAYTEGFEGVLVREVGCTKDPEGYE